jgi:predicted cupin superfamily sugar epimerase
MQILPLHSVNTTTTPIHIPLQSQFKMSSIPDTATKLSPSYRPGQHTQESPSTASVIAVLALEKHVEGGYFAEIDRDPLTIPNPFPHSNTPQTTEKPISGDNSLRNASTSIYYLLTPTTPQGHFHRNKGRTVHTLIEGRGRYVLIHADEKGDKKRVESFIVGKDVSKGEKAVWIVEGGKYKASYLLPMTDNKDSSKDRLLISEVSSMCACSREKNDCVNVLMQTVVPGFEFSDHDFLPIETFGELITEEQQRELEWLIRRE